MNRILLLIALLLSGSSVVSAGVAVDTKDVPEAVNSEVASTFPTGSNDDERLIEDGFELSLSCSSDPSSSNSFCLMLSSVVTTVNVKLMKNVHVKIELRRFFDRKFKPV